MKNSILKTYTQDNSSLEDFIRNLENSDLDIRVEKIPEASGWPITNLRLHVTDPHTWGSYVRIISHRPNSVHMVSSITTNGVSETQWKVFTILWWGVFHFGGPTFAPNFPAWGIDKGETVEQAALREMSEEIPVLKPEWITSVENISLWKRSHASIWWSSEWNYLAHIKAELPEWMSIEQLANHIGWVATEHERIESQVRELTPEVAHEVCGVVDKLGIILVGMKENPWFFVHSLQNVSNWSSCEEEYPADSFTFMP